MFTDTDSLTYNIRTEDINKDFWADKDKFDFSDYNKNSGVYHPTNKKVIGKMKDETKGIPIVEFVGLRFKMYSYVQNDEITCKKAKEILKNIVKNVIIHEDYKKILFNNDHIYHRTKTIRSENHEIYSLEINKKSLSSFDDKRYVCDNGIESFADGHFLTKE